MAPALFILGASGLHAVPVAMAWACEKSRVIAGRHEPGTVDELYRRQPAWPTFTAMLMQNFSDNLVFIADCQRVVYLSADAAA